MLRETLPVPYRRNVNRSVGAGLPVRMGGGEGGVGQGPFLDRRQGGEGRQVHIEPARRIELRDQIAVRQGRGVAVQPAKASASANPSAQYPWTHLPAMPKHPGQPGSSLSPSGRPSKSAVPALDF